MSSKNSNKSDRNKINKNNAETIEAGVSDKNSSEAGSVKEDKNQLMYQVVTKRDESVLKAFITFNYRVVHPKVFLRSILYAVVFFTFGFVSGETVFGLICYTIGTLCLCLALFRKYISLMLTKQDDTDYKNGTIFTYNFTNSGAQLLREDEPIVTMKNYRKSVTSFFSDQNFFYLGINKDDLFILPKDRFVVGDPSDFEGFIQSKTGKTSRWIPYGIKGIMYSLSNFSRQPMIDTEGWKDLAKSGKEKIKARSQEKGNAAASSKETPKSNVKLPKALKKEKPSGDE
ncbi:MAG: hypothetical protein IJH90_03940 [Mogibacterium sp.]|nr:hypothetical protein [Mogibacterium sp.]